MAILIDNDRERPGSVFGKLYRLFHLIGVCEKGNTPNRSFTFLIVSVSDEHLQRWGRVVNEDLISEFKVVCQVTAVDENTSLLRVPPDMHFLPRNEKGVVPLLDLFDAF